MIIILLYLFIVPCNASITAKTGKMDYSASWRNFALKEFSRTPVKTYPFENCFLASAKKYDLPVTLLLALARGESDFNPEAGSSKSCYGIMQIQWPGTARDLGFASIGDLYNPCRNISAGAKYLRQLLDRHNGDIHLALAAYNYGPGRIRRDMKASDLPQGATWYSGYIFHHLQQVLAGSDTPVPVQKRIRYNPGQKLPIARFHSPLRAREFLAYFKQNAPGVRLDWFRTSLGETCIVMIYDHDMEKADGIKHLKKVGYYVDINKIF